MTVARGGALPELAARSGSRAALWAARSDDERPAFPPERGETRSTRAEVHSPRAEGHSDWAAPAGQNESADEEEEEAYDDDMGFPGLFAD